MVSLGECDGWVDWSWTSLGEFRLHDLCLDAEKAPRLRKCDLQESFQQWKRRGPV